MASGTTGDSSDDLNWRGRREPTENIKVYTRRINRKVQKPANNHDTATTTTNPTAAGASTEVPSTSASEGPKNSASVHLPAALGGSPAAATASPGNARGNVVQASGEASVAEDADSSRRSSHHATASLRFADVYADSSFQQLKESRERHSPGDESIHNEGRQGATGRSPESQILENSMVPSSRDIPNCREDAGAQPASGNEPQNGGELVPVPPLVSEVNKPANANGVVKPLLISRLNDRIRFNLSKSVSKDEIKELRQKLVEDLEQVRGLVRQLEDKDRQLHSYETPITNRKFSNITTYPGDNIDGYNLGHPQHARTGLVDRRALVRVNSEIGAMGNPETRPTVLARMNSDMGARRHLEARPYNRQLSVSVMENNNRGVEFVEKEKRTPKANQYYRNSEFLLGKDRLPSESNKRLKTNSGRKHSGESEHSLGFGFRFDKGRNQLFKSCNSLLQRLMKHKHGWVFNEPVDAKAMGLVDYHDIIKHPMDLGTIKTRLSQNWYKSPRDFAEDIRLVFRNAMTYNPKGQDVHTMAEELSQVFEERWAVIETEYNAYGKYQMYPDAGLPTPTSRRASQSFFAPSSVPVAAPAHPGFIPVMQAPAYVPVAAAPFPLYAPTVPQMRTFDGPEAVMTPMAMDPKFHRRHVGRTPVLKKPKAKDPNKRDMTYDEKQRLSTHLQSLPSEKLDAIVQIIKKRNTALSQHNDEIEVDIDNVDPETLWELDRFVTNYKKSLSKNKRKAELALQARTVASQTVVVKHANLEATAAQTESGAAFERSAPASQRENLGDNGSRSSSSSSSSSDSESSTSDSDSDSSSADGSDAGHSPKT